MEPYTAREAMPQFHAVPNKETLGDSPGRRSFVLYNHNDFWQVILYYMKIDSNQKNKEAKKLLVLDWDGTLLDNLNLLYLCISTVFKKYGIEPPTVDQYRQEIDIDFMHFFYARGLPLEVTMEEVQQILKKTKYDYYVRKENPLNIKIREDAVRVLSRCHDLGIKTAVISAEVSEVLERGLVKFGVKSLLDHVRGFVFQKRIAILETCELFNISSAQSFYVDDLASGIENAKQAGVTVFGMMNNGHNSPERILKAKPHFAVDSLTEVLEIMEKFDKSTF